MRPMLSGQNPHPHHVAHSQIHEVEPGVWHVSGTTSARRLAKQLDLPRPEGRTVTVAGLMQRLNERVPRVGDRCVWDRYQLKVLEEPEDGALLIEIRPAGDANDAEPPR